jgi:hypothetical protein
MPKITTIRPEIIMYKPEWETTLATAKEKYGSWLSAWLAFDCIFGKRRNEICRLKRKDIWIQENYLYVRFYVGKKRNKKDLINQLPYLKKITLNHYATHYITEYLAEFDKWLETSTRKTEYIFPSSKNLSTHLKVKTKCKNANGETVTIEYNYTLENGYIRGQYVWNLVKKVNPKMWLHLGRHSVATALSETGASEYDISNALDVSPRVASRYVHHGTALTEKWSNRTA